eukprot:409265_1
MDAHELKSIKETDLFLYYSIPAGKRAESEFSLGTSRTSRCGISTPSTSQASQVEVEPSTQTVTRRSRISFECHPDLLLHDVFLSDTDDLDCA